ncbi:PsbP-related protein [Deinococcus pimensis]|uniref:PsbP-related protein n=1 Tax=Deinococcus pimensis TaxID=309888 RepID=UPI0004886F83|nr:PsbP-related protein [Deinococcus pimensis]
MTLSPVRSARALGLSLVALALPTFALAQTAYVNRKFSFTTTYPKGWLVKEDLMGAAVFFLEPPKPGAFTSNVNVIVEKVPPGGTLTDLVEAAKTFGQQAVTDFNLLAERERNVGALKGRELIYEGRQGQYTLRWSQLFAVQNGRAVAITLTADRARFNDVYARTGEVAINFKLK